MALSLHTATVGTYLQILPQVAAMLDKAEAHCREHGLADEALTGTRLADDMWPFAKQVSQCAHHSARAITGVRAGVFSPEPAPAPLDFASLRHEIADAVAMLEGVDPGELDAIAQRDMRFEWRTTRMDFTVGNFLLSFSLPNFHFHAITAYGLLRQAGVNLGKRDYLGQIRVNS